MLDNFDRELMKMANNETFHLPEGYDERIEKTLDSLRGRRRRLPVKGAILLAAALALLLSVTVVAAVSYVRQRMEAMGEKKQQEYYESLLRSSAEADSYSREMTKKERTRFQTLRGQYENEGLFPQGELRNIKEASEYDGKGVAFLESHSIFFLPETELSDEELLQIIDFYAKRDFSLQEIQEKVDAGEIKIPEDIKAERKVELRSDERFAAYEGDMKIQMAVASTDAIYFSEMRSLANGHTTCLYRMDADSDVPVKLPAEAPEGMEFTIIATDTDGNLCVFLHSLQPDAENSYRSEIWKLDREGKVLKRLDVTEAMEKESRVPTSFDVDKDGRYFLVTDIRERGVALLVLDEEGKKQYEILRADSAVRGVGRGKDGMVYGLSLEGEDYVPAVISFDSKNGKVDKRYTGILPEGVGAFETISAGTESDVLIAGPTGVYSYNFGDEKAVQCLAPYDLPTESKPYFLPNGMVFLIDFEYGEFSETEMDFEDFRVKGFYYMKAYR